MKRYAVIGASSGTGLALVRKLAAQQYTVRAISRHPPPPAPFIEPHAADVTDAHALAHALDAPFDAVFYTVDIHGLLQPREAIRATMVEGCKNALAGMHMAAARHSAPELPRFVLLSVIGPEKPSWVWWVLNASKRGMQRNVLDREKAVRESGLPYIICRAPRLNDKASTGTRLAATSPYHTIDMSRGIARADLARALILAAERAPANTTWDVFADPQAEEISPRWLQAQLSD